jgi:2-polyprenyl-6-methoxyphenol hydroxylase-like FAD-dependent oxidoreductase
MMLGLLLARAGVDVLVLEKHADFLRDFRGDTIHPSTLEVMHELGSLPDLLRLPHAEARQISAHIGNRDLPVADFTHLPTRCRFLVFMPQWDFLDFLAGHAGRYPQFRLRMRAEVTELTEDSGRITGVRATTSEGLLEVRADLVVGADGRHSRTRAAAGLEVREFGAPMDVLWFRLSRRESDPGESMGRIFPGGLLVMIDRGDYWQCGLVIPKGAHERVRERGLPAFRDRIARLAPFAGDRVDELCDWENIKLLSVQVDRLCRWFRPGLLCIGDAAHAMSPVGGVGINLAIQDAVAAARFLAEPLRRGRLTEGDLRLVQRRRELPTRITQRLQLAVQNRVIERVLSGTAELSPPLALRLLANIPRLRRIPARLIGLGIRPEHVSRQERRAG